MNYYDILLAKKLEDNRDPQVVGLSVTENGTYSEEGKVYKPVVVNVPLPENAYLLKSIENESIATFTDGTDNYLKSLAVAIEPIQSGSGEPSPSNIRPISGWDECKVTVADDLENPTVSNVYTLDLDGTRYGGKLDVVNGVLTVDRGFKIFDGSNDEGITAYNTSLGAYYLDAISDMEVYIDTSLPPNVVTNYLKPVSQSSSWGTPNIISQDKGGQKILIGSPNFGDSVEICRAYLSTNNLQLLYKLATPLTIQLPPTIIKSLQGENNFFASTGEIELLQYFGKETA